MQNRCQNPEFILWFLHNCFKKQDIKNYGINLVSTGSTTGFDRLNDRFRQAQRPVSTGSTTGFDRLNDRRFPAPWAAHPLLSRTPAPWAAHPAPEPPHPLPELVEGGSNVNLQISAYW